MSWFADIATRKRYELPEIGGWIELRNELSIKEERDTFANAVRGASPSGDTMKIEYDHSKLSFGRVVAYLADWSAKESLTPSAIGALKVDVYEVIEKAVDAHVKELEAKNSTGKTEPTTSADPTLPSAA